MKLIFCPDPTCYDIVKLQRTKRTCKCGKSWGGYLDENNAVYGGLAIPISFGNNSFKGAVSFYKADGKNLHFDAWIASSDSTTFKNEVPNQEEIKLT